ncbi:MAG TPA: serine/threonine-protein kinase, partial [candidate division Zixibacteria bacterium]|nr:serine/threonine-protein kinase [candidate division Zixibacteria bacterium]
MGEVYLALDTELQREVALKLINDGYSSNRVANHLFGAEARIAAGFSHPHSVVIHEIGKFGDRPYIAMEYVTGKSLHEVIQSGGLSVNESLQTALQIAACLESAHDQNIVHGDISATNVLLSDDGQAKVLDFGVSGLSGSNSPVEPITLGNPSYLAPERIHGASISPATDLFSLGVLLYYML